MSSVCGSNKVTIFLLGGEFEDNTAALVYAFNISNPVWTVVNYRGPKPIRRSFLAGVCNDAKIYSFRGTTIDSFGDDLDIFDTNQLTWSLGNRLNIPPPMGASAAISLPDGRIIYIGGNTAIPPKHISISEVDNILFNLILSEFDINI